MNNPFCYSDFKREDYSWPCALKNIQSAIATIQAIQPQQL